MHHDMYSESGKQLSDMESILKSMGFAKPIDEAKMSKEKHKKEAKKGKRWQDSDGDGKWYEPGEDVKKEEYDNTKPDPKVTAEKKARLEKKRGMKLDDHPEYKKEEVEIDEATAMAKRGHDETAIRNKIAKSTGGGAAADRATALENKPTYGDAKKAKQRSDYARKQRGDFRNTNSSNPGLHGYGHQSNDPKVKAKQAARGAQRGSAALTPKEKKQLNRESNTFKGFLERLNERKICNKCGQEICECANRLDEGLKQARANVGMDPNKPSCWKGYEAKGTKMKGGKEVPNCVPKEEYLHMATEMIEEGYEEEDVRLAIEWIEDGYTVMFEEDGFYAEEILDEAHAARNNPEKYEAGEKKKYAPVRGEKTPMPPRGDKRREDFEKWYAKNVR